QIKGTYGYQVCTDVDGRCIPFDDEFAFNFTVLASNTEALQKDQENTQTARAEEQTVKESPAQAAEDKKTVEGTPSKDEEKAVAENAPVITGNEKGTKEAPQAKEKAGEAITTQKAAVDPYS